MFRFLKLFLIHSRSKLKKMTQALKSKKENNYPNLESETNENRVVIEALEGR